MKILAIDTTGIAASAAIVSDGKLLAESFINFKLTHSQTIMPLIDDVVKKTDTDLKDVDYIACSEGPGSFTGLRIGAATAKGLALGLNKKVITVPTLDVLAYNIFGTDNIICPIMDARRNQVYSAFYKWADNELIRLSDYMAEGIDLIIEKALEFNKKVIFLGDGVPVHGAKLEKQAGFIMAPASLMIQRASSLAIAAEVKANKGEAINGSEFEVMYLRKSQAEREREEKLASQEDGK